MKEGCAGLLIVLLACLLTFSCLSGTSKDSPPAVENTASAEDCARASGTLKRAFPGRGYNNPKPGVFYMPAIVWASASQEDRQNVAKILAIQKGCETGSDPLYSTVEIRSISDNRLLAKGPVWDLEEQ